MYVCIVNISEISCPSWDRESKLIPAAGSDGLYLLCSTSICSGVHVDDTYVKYVQKAYFYYMYIRLTIHRSLEPYGDGWLDWMDPARDNI